MLRLAVKNDHNETGKHPKKCRKRTSSFVLDDKSVQASGTKELERLVFGGEDEVLEELAKQFECNTKNEEVLRKNKVRKAVWQDEDDNNIMVETKTNSAEKDDVYASQIRKKFVDHIGTPKWAQLDRVRRPDDSDEGDEDILKTSSNLLSAFKPLTSGNIDIHSCKDVNHENWTKGIIKCIRFHPQSQVALVGNFNGTVTLYQVDGKTNPKIQSVHFERFSLESAHFTEDGEHIIVGSPDHHHLYYYDMMVGKIVKVPWARGIEHCSTKKLFLSPDGKYLVICGRFGEMHLLTVKSKELVGNLKMNGEVGAIAFSKDGSKMYSHGDAGEVYVWDMKSRRCLYKFYDEGCIRGTSLAVSPNDQHIATGSDTGVVNIYDTSELQKNPNPKPLKAVLNLTTDVTSLKFNHTSEILAMASPNQENAVKLLHVPTTSVFQNFPQGNLKRINCLDVSLNSGYLTLGNNVGRALLYRMKHFSNY